MGDTMGHKHQLQKSVKNHNHLGSSGYRPAGVPPLRDLNYITRQNQPNDWQRSKGEDRMQAFILATPGRASSGTGVFFPATASHPPTKKQACSPVLLPARVVKSLNLNVHNNEIRGNDLKKKSETVETPLKNTEVEDPIDSLEKLLPEEWTY